MIVPSPIRLIRHGLLGLSLVWAMSGCASYNMGHGSLFRSDVRTVHVPVFQSDSYRDGLGERLTEAVVKEIEAKTPYKVVSAEMADSVLDGRIMSESKRVIGEDAFDVPRLIEADLVAHVEWKTRGGQPIGSSFDLPLNGLELRVNEAKQFIPEAGQSIASSHQEMIRELARQIVAQMEMPW
ncbi:MAG: LptE family protein [Pirellulaceae bacterium]